MALCLGAPPRGITGLCEHSRVPWPPLSSGAAHIPCSTSTGTGEEHGQPSTNREAGGLRTLGSPGVLDRTCVSRALTQPGSAGVDEDLAGSGHACLVLFWTHSFGCEILSRQQLRSFQDQERCNLIPPDRVEQWFSKWGP